MRDSIDYIYKALAEKHNVPKELFIQLEKDYWKSIKREMSSRSGRNIIIPNLGSIKLNRFTVNAVIYHMTREKQELEDTFKNGGIRWISYLKKWKYLTSRLVTAELIKENALKRDVRKKGQRGI